MDQQDNGKLIDFTEKFKTQKELQEYARAQFLTLLNANRHIQSLEMENQQLRSEITILKTSLPLPNEAKIISKSTEQDICEIEINRIKDLALQGPLTMEDTKRLDLLVKNLYIAKGKPISDIPTKGKKIGVDNKDVAELVKLATLMDNNE